MLILFSLPLFTLAILILIYITWLFFNESRYVVDCRKHGISKNNLSNGQIKNYPNGWLPVYESKDLSLKRVVKINRFGKNLILYRGHSGKVYLFEQYCSHTELELDNSFRVINDNIQCLAHDWVFDSKRTSIDNFSKQEIKLKTYQTIEVNGFICAWHHSENHEPTWYPEDAVEISKDDMFYRSSGSLLINCSIREFFENTSDVQHFDVIHTIPSYFGNTMKHNFLYFLNKFIHFTYTFEDKKKLYDNHCSTFDFHIDFVIFGIKFTGGDVHGQLIGPALENIEFTFTLFGYTARVYNYSCIIQLDLTTNYWIQYFYSPPGIINKIFAKLIQWEQVSAVENDGVIWQNKKFLEKPYFLKREHGMVAFRRWYNKFYDPKTVYN